MHWDFVRVITMYFLLIYVCISNYVPFSFKSWQVQILQFLSRTFAGKRLKSDFSMDEIAVPRQWFFSQETNNFGRGRSDGSAFSSMDSTKMASNNKEQFYQQSISNSPQRKPSKSNPLEPRLRRIRANNRERRRIQAINDAMEALRKVIPSTGNKRKLTKLELLRLAQNYIRDLSEMLCSDNSTPEGEVVNVSFSHADYASFFPEACFTT